MWTMIGRWLALIWYRYKTYIRFYTEREPKIPFNATLLFHQIFSPLLVHYAECLVHMRKGQPKWIVKKKGDKYLTELIVYTYRGESSDGGRPISNDESFCCSCCFWAHHPFFCWVLGEMRAAEIVVGFHHLSAYSASIERSQVVVCPSTNEKPRAKTRYRDRRKHLSPHPPRKSWECKLCDSSGRCCCE